MKVKLNDIKNFLNTDDIAIAGVSRNRSKFGYIIFKELKIRQHNLFPINPNADSIDNNHCYKDVLSLPDHVKHLHIVTSKKYTYDLVKQAIEKGITHIWIQQRSETPESIELALNNGINLIHNKCILMYAEPVKGIHSFHKFLNKVFGLYPK